MKFSFRPLTPADRPLIEELVRGYYEVDGLTYDSSLHGPALEQLGKDDTAGKIWIVEDDGRPPG